MQTPPLLDGWLEAALEHLTSRWLQSALAASLSQLVAGEIAAEDFAEQLTSLLEARGLLTPAQQKNYRSNVTQALKSIHPQHPAIPQVALSTETYRELNDIQRGRLAEAQTKFISSDAAEQLVERATQLLSSPQWSEVGAGLAVLIGRRVSEILLSRFEPLSPWSIRFSHPAKKPADLAADFAIEIPTLAPADQVLAAICKLQQGLRIDDLKATALTLKGARQKINQRFSAAIAQACNRHFTGLVEARADRDDLYSHLFRAIYATIATHWFCPPNVPEHTFKAEIQGHFTLAADGAKLPNFSARANYDDYAIGDGMGNRDGRLGVKLGALSGIRVLAAFDASRAQLGPPAYPAEPVYRTCCRNLLPSPPRPQPCPNRSLPRNRSAARSELTGDTTTAGCISFTASAPPGLSQVERTSALLEWAERQISQPATAQPDPAPGQAIPELAKTMAWLTARIESLEAEALALKTQRDQWQAQVRGLPTPQQVAQLQAENAQLKAQLSQTQATLGQIRSSLGNLSGTTISVARRSSRRSSSRASRSCAAPIGAPISPSISR